MPIIVADLRCHIAVCTPQEWGEGLSECPAISIRQIALRLSNVADLAWREDNRRKSNGQLTALVLFAAMRNPTSRNFCGYWQGNSPPDPDFEDFDRPFAPA